MSNCNCNSLSCGRVSPWVSCRGNWGCGTSCGSCGNVLGTTTGCGCNTCGCNRCCHWNTCNSCSTCGSVAGDATCSVCGNSPCTCGNWWGCNTCDSCCDGVSSGCMTPRFISIGRTFQRRITQTLCVDDIPDCAESPLTLVSVTVSGQASWEQISECRQQLLRVTVPVAVQIRDCAGRCRTGHSTVTLTIPLCRHCPAQDFWRGQLYVAPCIRLAAPVTENEDGCFDATLEVQAEVFLVRMQLANC